MPDPRDTDTEEFVVQETVGASLSRPAPRAVRAEFGAVTHQGKVRAKNQDHYLITRMSRSLGVLATNVPAGDLPDRTEQVAYGMVIADGMGGMASGEKASILAIRTGVNLVLNSPRWALKIDDHEARQLIERMREYFLKVDRTLVEHSQADRSMAGMGTTLTVAYSAGADLFIVHAGDSRAYLFRHDRLLRLTHDHTVAQHLADVGVIRTEDVPTHATRHVLRNFVGGPALGIEPEIYTLGLADGDRLLLCSDGLTEMVREREIAAIFRQQDDPQSTAQALVARALECGGRDNVTALVARYEIDGDGRDLDRTTLLRRPG